MLVIWVRKQLGLQLGLFRLIVQRAGGIRIAAAIRRSDRERKGCPAERGARGESGQYDGYAESATRPVVEAERLSPRFDAQRERCLDGMKQRARLVISRFRNQTDECPGDQGRGDSYGTCDDGGAPPVLQPDDDDAGRGDEDGGDLVAQVIVRPPWPCVRGAVSANQDCESRRGGDREGPD